MSRIKPFSRFHNDKEIPFSHQAALLVFSYIVLKCAHFSITCIYLQNMLKNIFIAKQVAIIWPNRTGSNFSYGNRRDRKTKILKLCLTYALCLIYVLWYITYIGTVVMFQIVLIREKLSCNLVMQNNFISHTKYR